MVSELSPTPSGRIISPHCGSGAISNPPCFAGVPKGLKHSLSLQVAGWLFDYLRCKKRGEKKIEELQIIDTNSRTKDYQTE